MDRSSPSGSESVFSTSIQPSQSAVSSPPFIEPDEDKMENGIADQRLVEQEETARTANDKAEAKRAAARRRKWQNKKKGMSGAERAAKALELNGLLAQTEAFSNALLKKSNLGMHELAMAEQPALIVGGTMRDYQLEGLTWMTEICTQGLSGILADEMGLGKTVQTISLIALLRGSHGLLGPHLIVAPLSTLSNWINEFEMWAPDVPVVMYHGNPGERNAIFKQMMKQLKGGRPTDKFPVVCTSYEIILRDSASLSKIGWEFIIIDEGHRMKNFESKLFRELQTFRSMTRFLITGTPLQNNLRELWSLLHFLMPRIFQDWEAFDSWFDFTGLEDEQRTAEFIADSDKQDLIKKIHRVLQPLLLRRVKADVASYLPKKREYILYAPMTKEQTDLYNAINNNTVDTRAYLESKVVERLTRGTDTTADSRKASPRQSRASSVGAKATPRKGVASISIPVRSSPRSKKALAPAAEQAIPKTNAFAMMMGKRGRGGAATNGKDTALAPPKVTTPMTPKKELPKGKRKMSPASETPVAKSARSSRDSTPASTRVTTRSTRKGKASYKETDASDEDLMSDGEFEATLVKERDQDDVEDAASPLSAEDIEKAKTLEQAKKEIANKKLGNPVMQLRLTCNSPHNFYNPFASAPVDESLVTASGKMLLLDRLLPALFQKGHKVLVFSQFTTQLDILEDYCSELRKWEVCRIDGSVAQDIRRNQIAQFNAEGGPNIFLLSTRAGGQGINLAAADTVILFDSDWNPQQDLQAQDRAHRIGQKRPVVVYRLATKGTVEEDLLLSADAKRRLEKLVIKEGGFKTMGQKMDAQQELDKDMLSTLLLKDGQVYKFSGDKEILSDHDIDVLCDRSDEAYARASAGQGDAAGYQVVETGAEGITTAAQHQ